MTRRLRFCLLAAVLGGCAMQTTQPPQTSASAGVLKVPGDASPQLDFKLASGTYRCESGAQVEVRRNARDPNLIRLGWQGASYPMLRNASYSGLPRYEDAASGLVWIDLPWKSVLLDGKSGKPLVSECRGGPVG